VQEKIYKASLLKQIMVVVRRTLYILWATTIIVNAFEKIVCENVLYLEHLRLYYYWKTYLIFFILIILSYSILYVFKLNNVQVRISNKTMFIKKNGREEQYNLWQPIVEFEKQATQTFMSFDVISKYVMKTLSTDGSVKEYGLLAFNKRVLYELSEDITKIQEGMNQNDNIWDKKIKI